MHEALHKQLRRAIRKTGLDAGTIARQADVDRGDMAALLRASGEAKVQALEAVAIRLGLVVRLEQAQEERARSAVPSVIDAALDALEGRDVLELKGMFGPATGAAVDVQDMDPAGWHKEKNRR